VIRPTNAQQLQEHLDTVLLRARDGPRSSNAKRIVQQRLTASLENESTGIRRLELLLLLLTMMTPTQPVKCLQRKTT
jgi:hypothetical protein